MRRFEFKLVGPSLGEGVMVIARGSLGGQWIVMSNRLSVGWWSGFWGGNAGRRAVRCA